MISVLRINILALVEEQEPYAPPPNLMDDVKAMMSEVEALKTVSIAAAKGISKAYANTEIPEPEIPDGPEEAGPPKVKPLPSFLDAVDRLRKEGVMDIMYSPGEARGRKGGQTHAIRCRPPTSNSAASAVYNRSDL